MKHQEDEPDYSKLVRLIYLVRPDTFDADDLQFISGCVILCWYCFTIYVI